MSHKNRRRIVIAVILLAAMFFPYERMTDSLPSGRLFTDTVAAASPSPYLKITVIDYGGSSSVYGDATLLESGGKYLLIDTGARDSKKSVIHYLKKKGVKNLSLYISHFHEDHCDYAETILKDSWFHVNKVYLANPDPLKRYVTSYYKSHNRRLYEGCKDGYDRYKGIVAASKKKKISIKNLRRGDTFSIGDAKAKVLWDHNSRPASAFDPYDKTAIGYANNSSLVTKFTLGKRSFLTAGDIECSTEKDLLAAGTDLSADIFKLNHHGIWSSNTVEFVKAVNPCYIYYSYKAKNKDPERKSFGSAPDVSSTIRKLKNEYNILSSRYNGTIIYRIQDNTIEVSAERHVKTKKLKLSKTSNGKSVTQKLVYNSAQDLHLDARMLPAGTVLASGTVSDASGEYNGWKKDSIGWRYRTKKGVWLSGGWKAMGSKVYYFTIGGYRYEGWLKKDGKTYFLSRTGVRQTGWQMIDGKVYYFHSDGTRATGKTRINGVKWPLRSDGSLDLSKKNAPDIDILTAEHRHTTKPK